MSSNNNLKKVVILYPYFLPAYKAGGPIQSIANLCRYMYKDYNFHIICGDTDMNEQKSLEGIVPDSWNSFEMDKAKVYYLSPKKKNWKSIKTLLEEIEPDFLFINGLFSPLFSLLPLLYDKGKIIMSVRGMLHPGALSQKKWKKRIFLTFLRIGKVPKRIIFHATDAIEKEYVFQNFGTKVKVVIAQNLPSSISSFFHKYKKPGELKLVSISLISAMKNIDLVLKSLAFVSSSVVYDIYGPIKDESYWKQCLELISILPKNIEVNYKGSLPPEMVNETLSEYHMFILPSKSENFGHALYEALKAGKPVITSYFTPWNGLDDKKAGWNIDIHKVKTLTAAIENAATLDDTRYIIYATNAKSFANMKIDMEEIKNEYKLLFA